MTTPDAAAAVALAGPMPDLDQTFADAIRWMVEVGHLPAGKAGALVAQGTEM